MKKSISYALAAALLIALGTLAPAVRGFAADGSDSDAKIARVLETQEKLLKNQEKIIASLEEIKAELKIIKIRATMK